MPILSQILSCDPFSFVIAALAFYSKETSKVHRSEPPLFSAVKRVLQSPRLCPVAEARADGINRSCRVSAGDVTFNPLEDFGQIVADGPAQAVEPGTAAEKAMLLPSSLTDAG